ncbi:MAG: IS21 family transposase [Marinobacter sp.]|jgi:transposase|uniref:IS21 family transposase n=1 Tax=Marinobacter sp. TaxID=50741 RepID=UPI00396ECF3F
MTERKLKLMDVRGLLLHFRAESSDRQIQRDTGLNRRTIQRYRAWAKSEGLLEGALPTPEELAARLQASLPEKTPPQNQSAAEGYREEIKRLLDMEVEVAAIYQRLLERGFTGSYASVYRLARRIKPTGKHRQKTTRVERPPAEEAQVDFGYAGRMIDPESGQLRKTWVYVMTLSWSRHQYVEFVWDQKIQTWLRCHRNAFEFFGGVPARIVLDNLKTAIVKAIQDDPQVQSSYQECALHYGFLLAPCRVATPEHKGKVEKGGVHYVVRNFLGGRTPTTLIQANKDVRRWCLTTAGQRIHGTTFEAPLKRFEEIEQALLKPLPASPYDLAVWKKVKVYRDCYVSFDHAFYSVPHRLYPGSVWICGGTTNVRIYDLKYTLQATHERATQAGQRITHTDHLPPEKLPGLLQTRESVVEDAQKVGPATGKVVQELLEHPVLDRLSTAGRLVRLANQFSPERLEAACQKALAYGDGSYRTIKGILKQGTESQTAPLLVEIPPATTFARSKDELVAGLMEVGLWN